MKKRKNKNRTGAFGKSFFNKKAKKEQHYRSNYPKITVSREVFQRMVDEGVITERGVFIFKPNSEHKNDKMKRNDANNIHNTNTYR